MARRQPAQRLLRFLCAEVFPDDGVDPRLQSRNGSRKPARKARQLCGQVADTLSYALTEQGDDILGGLQVLDVQPAPDAGRLLVTVAPLPSESFDAGEILSHLDQAAARLRCAVAAAITRRRAPALVFRIALVPEATDLRG